MSSTPRHAAGKKIGGPNLNRMATYFEKKEIISLFFSSVERLV